MSRRVRPWLVVAMLATACGIDLDLSVPPTIALSRRAVVLSVPIGAPPGVESIKIVNGTDGTLQGLSATIEYPAGAPNQWLTATLEGSSATREQAATLTLRATAGTLPLGSVVATVKVAAQDAGNGPLAIRVEMVVRPRPPAKLRVRTQPDGQLVNGGVLTPAPVVELLNAIDEPAQEAGVVVTAAIVGGGALGGATSKATDQLGRVTFSDLTITGLVGAKTLSFSVPGLPPASSNTVTVAPGAPRRVEAASAVAQTADAGTIVAEAPRVRVVDQSGNGITGFDVAFVASTGSVIVPAGTIATSAAGFAALTSWTLRPLAGANTVTASATGLEGSPVVFSATGRIGPAALLVKQSGDNLIGIINTTLGTPHVVAVTDAAGNGIGGVTVTWSAAGGGTVAPTTTVTDGNGVAAATRTLGPATGPVTTTASATIAGSLRTQVFSVTAANAGPAQIVKVGGDAQSAQAGATLPLPLQVRVLDAVAAPLANVTVTFTTPNGGAFLPSATAVTDGTGLASASWRLGNQTGGQTAQAAVGGPPPAGFTATALAGPVSAAQSTIAATPTTIGAGGTSSIVVTARDALGNPVSGAPVVLQVFTGAPGVTQPPGPTGGTGQATGTYSSTVAGTAVIRAVVDGVTLTQTATVTVQPGGPALIAAVSSTTLSARFGQPVSPVPSVRVTDQFGNNVPNVSILFSVPSGGGVSTPSPASVSTNSSGIATLGSWTITAFAGNIGNTAVTPVNLLRATLTGVPGSPVTFTATVAIHYTADLQSYWDATPNGISGGNGCIGCHGGAQVPLLTSPSHNDLVNPPTNTYVTPGNSNPAVNFLLRKLNGTVGHTGGTRASHVLTIIATWIQQGALNLP